ncbi:MAG: hypothetical protein DRO06_00760 [Thermoproteota archaeon]|nr:MAG: hypothetical protein DRO06_00760 [Candidatus Korarchaeota archaeon]
MRSDGVVDYLMMVVGALAGLAALVLLTAFGVISLEESPGLMTLLMSFPILVDIFVLSPGIPQLFLILTIVPLLLMVVLALRIMLEVARRGASAPGAVPSKRYSLAELTLFGIGATVGPSAFVVLPEAVSRYGPSALVGVALASVSAILRAMVYAEMDSLTFSMGSPSVGGPAFVRRAYGPTHPAYMASRFSMWVANTALASFNMLVLMDVVTLYVLPDVLSALGAPELAPKIDLPVRALIFVLSVLALKYARSESSLVRLQSLIGPAFVALFAVHVLALAASAAGLSLGVVPPPSPRGWLPAPLESVSAMAYVYMVVFGFQEVQSLAEGLPESPAERRSVLEKALLVSVLAPAALFCVYAASLLALPEIPEAPIPAVDATSGWLRLLTEGALLLGIATTFIPALVTASNHLRELLIDVFDVDRETAESPVGRYLVAFFVLILVATNASYLVELTDFGVLIAMGIIAASEIRLSKLAGVEPSPALPAASSLATAAAALVLAFTSPDVAFGGVLFVLAATMALGAAAYELEVVELFTLACSILALLVAPPVIGAMERLSEAGALPVSTIAFLPFAQTALDVLGISTVALLAHIAMKRRRTIARLLRPVVDRLAALLARLVM